jgi:hypothetical protein
VGKKGSEEGKQLAQNILDNAKTATARSKKAAEGKTDIKNGDLATGVKRGREGDTAGQPAKKMVRAASKPLALQNAEKRKAAEEAAKKTKAGATTNGTLITPVTSKTKAPLSAPKSAASFSALMSASKKPGTTIAERAAASKKEPVAVTTTLQQVKKEPLKRESPPATAVPSVSTSKSSSFLSGIFAGAEEKDETPTKKEEVNPDETPEQRAKRLRKESRRKLRVSWKPDSELTDIRLFTHDPDEEINSGDSAHRDAGDTGKEGEMLKRHKEMDVDDDDDEGADFDPDCYGDAPSQVDFTEMASEDCQPEINGIKNGGTLSAESKARDIQNKLEESTLMVMYTSATDRPNTPKEPAEEEDDDFEPPDEFGRPDEKVLQREERIRARQRNPFGSDGHTDFASSLHALQANSNPQYNSKAAQPAAATTDVMAALAQLTQQRQQAIQPAAPSSNTQDLAAFIRSFQANLPQSQQQPTQQQPAYQSAAQPQIDLNAILARLPQNQQQGFANSSGYTPTGSNDDSSMLGGRKNKKRKNASGVPLDENGLPLNYKTKVCEYWEKGMCIKGDACTFRHSK